MGPSDGNWRMTIMPTPAIIIIPLRKTAAHMLRGISLFLRFSMLGKEVFQI